MIVALPFFSRSSALIRLLRRAYGGYQKQIAALVGFGFLGGILEGIGINAIIPLLTFILKTDEEATDPITGAMRVFFDFLGIDFAPKYLLIFIVLLMLGRSLVLFFLYYIQIQITTHYEARTRARLYSAVLRSSWPNLLKQQMGHLETWLMVDTPACVAILKNISSSIMLVTSLVMYLIVAFNISPAIMLTTLALGILVLFAFRPITHRVRILSAERAVSNSTMAHRVSESVSGLKTIKATGVEEGIVRATQEIFERIRALSMRVNLFYHFTGLVIPPLGVVYIAIVFAIAFRTDFITLSALPAAVYLIYRIAIYVQQLQSAIQNINEQAPHLQRILQFTEDAESHAEVQVGTKPFVFTNEMRLDTLSFSYNPAQRVLSDISFSIPRGSFTGLIGPSGAGKTTVVDILLRLLTPDSGMLSVDGVDAREIDLNAWRAKIAYVSQDFFIVNDTIRNNIAFYTSMPDEDIMHAAKMAHIDEMITHSENGLDTVVGDRGMTLSAGQRQRLVIARALAHKPEILILDEATSALDAESEAHIKGIIEGLKGKITIIAIAHRLSTIMDADTLIALESGKVVEQGSPEKLLKDKDSYFYKVYSIV